VSIDLKTSYKDRELRPDATEAQKKKHKAAESERARTSAKAAKSAIDNVVQAIKDEIIANPEKYKAYFNKIVDNMAAAEVPQPDADIAEALSYYLALQSFTIEFSFRNWHFLIPLLSHVSQLNSLLEIAHVQVF